MAAQVQPHSVPRDLVFRRLHSLFGLWFTLFLCEHLFTNSQAALFFGDDGKWFIASVNFLHSLPYLPLIEFVLLGVPIIFHAAWGIKYAISARQNSMHAQQNKPKIKTARNCAYFMQRISSWILLFGLIFHVWAMRFYYYPFEVRYGKSSHYYRPFKFDQGLYSVADRLGVTIFSAQAIQDEIRSLEKVKQKLFILTNRYKEQALHEKRGQISDGYNQRKDYIAREINLAESKIHYINGLEHFKLRKGEVVGVSANFGAVVLLNMRQYFQSIGICIFYTIFVLAAVFHGFNGLWSFLITWGLLLSYASQKKVVRVCVALMIIFGFLGLIAIWGTSFINLRS